MSCRQRPSSPSSRPDSPFTRAAREHPHVHQNAIGLFARHHLQRFDAIVRALHAVTVARQQKLEQPGIGESRASTTSTVPAGCATLVFPLRTVVPSSKGQCSIREDIARFCSVGSFYTEGMSALVRHSVGAAIDACHFWHSNLYSRRLSYIHHSLGPDA